ncbi:UNVERIFIED_CONTAM: Aspartic proteinase CDR1 [Sesamum indicum]
MAFYYNPLSLILATFLLLSSTSLISLTEAAKNGGVTVDLIHRDSPLSPSYDPSTMHFERLRNSFRRSVSRQSALRSISFKSASKSSYLFEATLTPIGGEYLIKINIGTPPVEILAIADIFDPTKPQLIELFHARPNNVNPWELRVHPATNQTVVSTNNGDLAVETFTFDSSISKESVVFPKVVFGNGFRDRWLGGGLVSIVRQLETAIGGKFSYCLMTLDSKSPSKISFGPNAIVTGPNVSSTPIVQKSPDTFYYLTLEGVSVGNEALAYNYIPNSNSKASVEEGNIIINSGTTLTFLPSSLYEGLESTLEKSISGNPQGLFGLCYELPRNGEFDAPPIIAHFTEADVELTQESTFLEVEKGVVCLTFVPSKDLAIFGNLHQMNFLIEYDLENKKVGFLPTDCSKTQ